jgi:DnaK suppressor protein
MDEHAIEELAGELSRRRSELLQQVAESQEEMKAISEEQQAEFEESVQKDRITRLTSRLKERDRHKIREIDAALARVAAGAYGKCERCGNDIAVERLRALPTATLCINCASVREGRERASRTGEEPSERLPVRDLETEGSDEETPIYRDEE